MSLSLTEVDQDRTPRCCARCQRGTRAVPGPCAYDHYCPNPKCEHTAAPKPEEGYR